MKQATIQPGKYYLGDPCYSLNESWDFFLKQTDCFRKSSIAEVDGHQILAFKTKWGDGSYRSNTGRVFYVDAGMIGLVPIELSQEKEPFNSMVIEFSEPTLCKSVKGKLYFGRVVIDTN